jgi:hypothetical protein
MVLVVVLALLLLLLLKLVRGTVICSSANLEEPFKEQRTKNKEQIEALLCELNTVSVC